MRETLNLSHYKGTLETDPVWWHIGYDPKAGWYVMGVSFPITEAAQEAYFHCAMDERVPDGAVTSFPRSSCWKVEHGDLVELMTYQTIDSESHDRSDWTQCTAWLYEMEHCTVEDSYRNVLKSVLDIMEW